MRYLSISQNEIFYNMSHTISVGAAAETDKNDINKKAVVNFIINKILGRTCRNSPSSLFFFIPLFQFKLYQCAARHFNMSNVARRSTFLLFHKNIISLNFNPYRSSLLYQMKHLFKTFMPRHIHGETFFSY